VPQPEAEKVLFAVSSRLRVSEDLLADEGRVTRERGELAPVAAAHLRGDLAGEMAGLDTGEDEIGEVGPGLDQLLGKPVHVDELAIRQRRFPQHFLFDDEIVADDEKRDRVCVALADQPPKRCDRILDRFEYSRMIRRIERTRVHGGGDLNDDRFH